MKKMFFNATALALMIATLLCLLTSCSKPDEEDIVGTWQYDTDTRSLRWDCIVVNADGTFKAYSRNTLSEEGEWSIVWEMGYVIVFPYTDVDGSKVDISFELKDGKMIWKAATKDTAVFTKVK